MCGSWSSGASALAAPSRVGAVTDLGSKVLVSILSNVAAVLQGLLGA
jgi:hypothetical protein